jgi:hypothetical protein
VENVKILPPAKRMSLVQRACDFLRRVLSQPNMQRLDLYCDLKTRCAIWFINVSTNGGYHTITLWSQKSKSSSLSKDLREWLLRSQIGDGSR